MKQNLIISISILCCLSFFGCRGVEECCEVEKTGDYFWGPAALTPVEDTIPEHTVIQDEPKNEVVETPTENPIQDNPVEVEDPSEKFVEETPISVIDDPIDDGGGEFINEEVQKVELACSITGEKEGVVGIPSILTCTINNRGNAEALDYTFQIQLPNGLAFSDEDASQRSLQWSNLAAGDSKIYEFEVVPSERGDYTVTVEAATLDSDPAPASFTLAVNSKPEIKVDLEAPEKVRIEEPFEYEIRVSNPNTFDLTNVVIQDKIDADKLRYEDEARQDGGEWNRDKGIFTWKLDTLAPSESKVFRVKVTPVVQGTVVNKLRVKTDEKVGKQITLENVVNTSIGLQRKHFDTNDPVVVGDKTTYVFEIFNRGQKEARDVKITDLIPAESEFVEASVEGSDELIEYQVEGRKVTFDTISILAPGKSIKFNVTVKVTQVASLLNTFQITSEDFEGTLTSQEGTTSYPE